MGGHDSGRVGKDSVGIENIRLAKIKVRNKEVDVIVPSPKAVKKIFGFEEE